MIRTVVTQVRKCGKKIAGGLYLVSEGSENGVLPMWVPMHPPIPCADKFHRGPVVVNGAAILERQPENNWLAGASAERVEKTKANEWAMQRFGMTTDMRLKTGDTEGLDGADRAMEHLLNTITYHGNITPLLRQLAIDGVHEMPRVTEHYAATIRHFQEWLGSGEVAPLVSAVAAMWRMAGATAPKKRGIVIPTLMRILVLMNLRKDAMAMRERYNVVK
jgi:hypothetical protein